MVSCISALWTRCPWCACPLHSHADGVCVTKCMVKRVIHNGGRSRKEVLHCVVNQMWSQGWCRRINCERWSFCVSNIESFLCIHGNSNTPMHASHTHRDHLLVSGWNL